MIDLANGCAEQFGELFGCSPYSNDKISGSMTIDRLGIRFVHVGNGLSLESTATHVPDNSYYGQPVIVVSASILTFESFVDRIFVGRDGFIPPL